MEDLEELEREAKSLQAQGKYLEALEVLEQLLEQRKSLFGPESQPASQACLQLCELANLLAVKYLQKDDFQMSLDLLKRAEALSERQEDGKAVTYNNFACYYRRLGKTRLALSYLQKAESIEEKASAMHSSANTHLNMCAVLSQAHKHDQALEQAMTAIMVLQDELLGLTDSAPGYREKGEFLAMAFHNMAVELEYLKRYSEAIKHYRKAVEIARRYLPQGHKTTETLNQVLSTASKQVTALQVKTEKRKERAKSQSGVRGYMQNLRKRVTGTTPNKKRIATQMESKPKMESGKWEEEEEETGPRAESIEVESASAALGAGLDQHIPPIDPTPPEMVTTSSLLTPQDPVC